MAPAAATPQMSPAQLNQIQRAAVLRSAVDMKQPVFTGTVFPASNPVVTINPRQVGLIKRFVIEVSGTINNSGNQLLTLTDFGLANILANATFTDLNNNVRINTTGMHLSLLATAKRRGPYAASYQTNVTNGNNLSQVLNVPPASWPIIVAPQTIAAGANAAFRVVYELPLAYSDDDLRGAVYANVLNATQQIQLTLASNTLVAAGTGDTTFAVYSGPAGAAGSITSATITIEQEYLDQLPIANGNVILPILDLSTVYELKNTQFMALTANQDNPVSYSNYRSYLSTFAIFNNNGLSTGRAFGTDVNYWSLTSANFTNLFKMDALLAAQYSRDNITIDLPAGCYYFPSRRKPIETAQYGNMQLNLNPTVTNANAYIQVLFEDLALQNTLANAGSLASA